MDMVRAFDVLAAGEQPRAGGKGRVLAQLYQAGYPVPAGCVILPEAFAGDELKPEAWVQVQAQLERLRGGGRGGAFAVRSSALDEDSAQASFAGQFSTVLDVGSDEDICAAIHTVRRGRRSDRVQAYREAKGLAQAGEIAVVVQRLVRAELAGVLFTADPVTGSRRAMAGSLVHGLGDRLVSGEVTGEAFTLARPHGHYQGPAALARHAGSLYRLARRLEQALGSPQDIEWALAGGRLYILQARPITTLQSYDPATGAWNDSLTGDYLWSNANFGEAMPEVMTPLTWSVLEFTLDDWVYVPGFLTAGNIAGRLYLNISVLATVFHALGRGRQDLLQALEATLYMRLPDEMEIPTIPLSRRARLASVCSAVRVQLRQMRGARGVGAYLEGNARWFERTRARIAAAGQKAGLLALWHDDIKDHVKRGVWCVRGSAVWSADYTMALRRELLKLVGAEDADALIANLGSRTGGLASMGPLVELAQVARGELPREAYLARYGHRGPDEFELSVPRPAEDPQWLERELARMRESPVDIPAMLEKQRERFDAAWQRLQAQHPRQARSIGRRLAESARRAHLRERARSAYVRDRWLIRLFALRAGELAGLGSDIFFLTLGEVLGLLAGDDAALQAIPVRKATYLKQSALPPYPSVIRGRFDPVAWAADPQRRADIDDAQASHSTASATVINGAPASAGQIEGIVRVVCDPGEGQRFQAGEVLVAVQTDIAWTLLFPRAAAVITDVGAPLSHAAIVARELGIPAVVGCGDATQRLRTGDRVRVDGGRGVVEVLAGGG